VTALFKCYSISISGITAAGDFCLCVSVILSRLGLKQITGLMCEEEEEEESAMI